MYIHNALSKTLIHEEIHYLNTIDETKNSKFFRSMLFEYRNVNLLFRGLYRLQCFIRQVKFYKHIMLWHATT